MAANKIADEYSAEEARERLQAALKGARLAGHKPMESLTRKKAKAQPKKRKARSCSNKEMDRDPINLIGS
jgi:hypothetical protein